MASGFNPIPNIRKPNKTLYWFTNDLRVQDNAGLERACETANALACVYVIDDAWFTKDQFGLQRCGDHRMHFLLASLIDLKTNLSEMGLDLLVLKGDPVKVLSDLVEQQGFDTVMSSRNPTYNEMMQWQTLMRSFEDVHFELVDTATLFAAETIQNLTVYPNQFTPFRKTVEAETVDLVRADIGTVPSQLALRSNDAFALPDTIEKRSDWVGGESAALSHLHTYFDGGYASTYKKTRNELSGWHHSTKFSAWLANGCLSVKTLYRGLKDYESKYGSNESTYWIYFELLWREYFQWAAYYEGKNLFLRGGKKGKTILTSFYPARFKAWTSGSTPWPLVNACMHELNATGYLSNRGRQIVASCLVYELQLDWRCGAAYFEQQLIDYDAASNWGNWQYIAGVGADPRGGRHFNIEKQTQTYDPLGSYIRHWQGAADQSQVLDHVDMVDWPVN